MDQAEASGKTVDDALSRALHSIGATRADLDAGRVELQVLDEGRKGGLFGRGAKEALVRVERVRGAEAPPTAQPLPDTRMPRQGQQGQGQRQGQGQGGQGQRRSERGRRGGSGGGGGGQRRDARPSRSGFEQAPAKLSEADFVKPPRYDEETDVAPEAAANGGGGRGRGGRGRGGNGDAAPRGQRELRGQREPREHAPRAERDHDRERPRRHREEEPEVDPDINAEEVDFAATIIDDLLRLLAIDAELTIREPMTAGDGRGVVRAVVDIAGDDLGLLIGRRGDTLLSLQYLVNLIVTRQYPSRGGVSIDVEHYRHRRESQILSLTERMADRVRQTGSAITLEPMSAAERRLVHLALADDPELVTNSIGEGENRKVVISTRR